MSESEQPTQHSRLYDVAVELRRYEDDAAYRQERDLDMRTCYSGKLTYLEVLHARFQCALNLEAKKPLPTTEAALVEWNQSRKAFTQYLNNWNPLSTADTDKGPNARKLIQRAEDAEHALTRLAEVWEGIVISPEG